MFQIYNMRCKYSVVIKSHASMRSSHDLCRAGCVCGRWRLCSELEEKLDAILGPHHELRLHLHLVVGVHTKLIPAAKH